MSEPVGRTVDSSRTEVGRQRHLGRREFLGAFGAGAATTVGVSGTAAAREVPVVTMNDDHFDPVGLHVEPGTTVRFEVEAGSHSATAYRDRIPSEADPFDSGTISGGRFEHAFETPGTYDYYCIPHRSIGMVGRIVVGEPGGPAEATPIPDGDVPDSETIIERGAVGIDELRESGGDTHEGMMAAGPGMKGEGGPGWMMLVPVGIVTVLLSLVGGVAYWAARRGSAEVRRERSAGGILRERYARGELDEEEFRQRRERLERDE